MSARTWIVTRSSSNRYMGAYEWVRNAKSAAHFITREAAEEAARTARLQNGGVYVEPYAHLADANAPSEPEPVPTARDIAYALTDAIEAYADEKYRRAAINTVEQCIKDIASLSSSDPKEPR